MESVILTCCAYWGKASLHIGRKGVGEPLDGQDMGTNPSMVGTGLKGVWVKYLFVFLFYFSIIS